MSKFHVPDRGCGHCTAAIAKAVTCADEGADLAFDLDAHTVTLSSTLDDAALAGILAKEGYPATPAG